MAFYSEYCCSCFQCNTTPLPFVVRHDVSVPQRRICMAITAQIRPSCTDTSHTSPAAPLPSLRISTPAYKMRGRGRPSHRMIMSQIRQLADPKRTFHRYSQQRPIHAGTTLQISLLCPSASCERDGRAKQPPGANPLSDPCRPGHTAGQTTGDGGQN